MPGSEPLPPDLRCYRPAAVLVIDLVKHSTRDQATTMSVQSVLSEVLHTTLTSLDLHDVHFNHTGDGYVCTFVGDSSARVLDFVNLLYPQLAARLAAYLQDIRCGLDFGVVHLRRNPLTGGDTHFDQPGIQAARLEQAAQPGQVLSTVTVRSIFARHYPHMFGAALEVQTKDRLMSAFELIPCREWNIHIRQYLTDYIFRRASEGIERPGALLVVDDEPRIVTILSAFLKRDFPERELMQASSANEALALLQKQPCALIITDIVMSGMSGVDLIRIVSERVPDQIAIGISGYGSPLLRASFCRAGGLILLSKPIARHDLTRIVKYALRQPQGDLIRRQLAEVCDDVTALWCALHGVAAQMDTILDDVGHGQDVAQELLRHKAKHLVNDGIARLSRGVDPLAQMQNIGVQLGCVARLAEIVGRLGVQKIGSFIRALIGDLGRLHPDVAFALEDSVGDIQAEVHLGGVVVLAVAELIDNAVAATCDKGRVDVQIVALKAAGILQITVKDNGPGVQHDLEDRIFEEDVSTKGAGRGLGLHIVRESLRLLDGTITYERQNGSVFRVRLPMRSQPAAPTKRRRRHA